MVSVPMSLIERCVCWTVWVGALCYSTFTFVVKLSANNFILIQAIFPSKTQIASTQAG